MDWKETVKKARPMEERQVPSSNYASQIWKAFACLRRAYYDRVDPVSDEGDWFVTQEHGRIVGIMVADFCKRAGIWRGDEVRGGDSRFNLTYRIDVLIDDGEGGIVPLEVKSIKANKWEPLLQKGPVFAHIIQIQCYVHFHKPVPYDYGYLLYFNRNTDEVRVIKVEHDPVLGKEIEQKLDDLEFAVETRTLPERTSEERECKNCEYKGRCESED